LLPCARAASNLAASREVTVKGLILTFTRDDYEIFNDHSYPAILDAAFSEQDATHLVSIMRTGIAAMQNVRLETINLLGLQMHRDADVRLLPSIEPI
jgi:hypothetical protein